MPQPAIPMTENLNTKNILTASQILQLEKQGCFAPDWSEVTIAADTDLSLIRNCRFIGSVSIGRLARCEKEQGLFNAVIEDCVIGDNCLISNVSGRIKGVTIGDNVIIENAGRIEVEAGATFALGHNVDVLDETGSRPVPLFPELSSQLASLIAHNPRVAEHHIFPILQDMWEKDAPQIHIGHGSRLYDCKEIHNVLIGNNIEVRGAMCLSNGRVINNSAKQQCKQMIGEGVDAHGFMIVDGDVRGGVMLHNCFVGQGAHISDQFFAHDSLFFANCTFSCGEACAIIAGPYTVSMHKSSLLIGGEYSFMNAGSATNFSNHQYKLGPVHWGILDRGTKTASSAYMLWEAKVGAYSLLIGQHKFHPDTTRFPFSYLFSTPDGHTIVNPALMLRSCGLLRDTLKWPARDRRIDAEIPLQDNIIFDVLSPLTAQAMLSALPLLHEIDKLPEEADGYKHFSGLRFGKNSASRAIEYYTRTLVTYFQRVIDGASDEIKDAPQLPVTEEWIDLGTQILPAQIVEQIKECTDFKQISDLFNSYFADYKKLEYQWVSGQLTDEWRERLAHADDYTVPYSEAFAADRAKALKALAE